jgi:hypothetical protein
MIKVSPSSVSIKCNNDTGIWATLPEIISPSIIRFTVIS